MELRSLACHRASLASTAAALLMLAPLAAPAQDGADRAGDAPNALVAQALAYEHGEGVPKDPLKAAALYCEAGRAGNAEALFSLGWMYANGRGVERNDTIAASLFALAAASGHEQARKAMQVVRGDGEVLPECLRPQKSAVAAESTQPPVALDIRVETLDPFAELPAWKMQIAKVVKKLAPQYKVNPRLALAVIQVESNFDTNARSAADARGLMQLIPGTSERFNVDDPHSIDQNVRGGLAYLRWLLAYYRGQVPLAAAAYNAGEKAVDKYGGIPPYPETQEYVRRVLRLYKSDQHPYDARIVGPSPILLPVRSGKT